MSNNRAGAVVERARQAEENLVIQLDMKAGNPVSVGEPKPKRLTIAGLTTALIENDSVVLGNGFVVRIRTHPKTRARWLDG